MKGLAGELAAQFRGSGYAVSTKPDLPNALLGPDLLVARQGELFAFFHPKLSERRNGYELLVRLLLSRLALPDHVRTVLILDHRMATTLSVANLGVHFHSVVIGRMKPIEVIEQARAAPIRKIPQVVRRHVQLQAAVLLTPELVALDNRARSVAHQLDQSDEARTGLVADPLEVDPGALTGRSGVRLPLLLQRLPGLAIRSHTVIATPPPSSGPDRPLHEFLRYLPIVPLLAYTIDNGVPYPSRSIVGLFRSSNQLTLKANLSDHARSAANAGWRFVTDADESSADDQEVRLAIWARNHPYERS